MKRLFLLFFSLILLTGCQKNSYSKFCNRYKVFFMCNTMEAPFNQLSTPGRFLSVRLLPNGTMTVTDIDGHSTRIELSQKENNMFIMGLGGLIIGRPTLNNDDMEVWAYDLACPVCDSGHNLLSVDQMGKAGCAACGGIWDLNRSGFPDNGDMRPLYRYPATSGFTSVTVQN